MRISDWSSDVCSSDLVQNEFRPRLGDDAAERLGIDQPLAPGHLAGTRRMVQQHHAEVARLAEPPQHSGQAVELGGAEGAVGAEQRRRLRRAEADDGHRPRSEEHTSELQSLMRNSYAVFCLKKKKHTKTQNT